jgi:hypothetical protein
MITQRYFERDGEKVLLRIAISETSVLDILTTDEDLARCRQLLLSTPLESTETIRMGSFGALNVTLTVSRDDSATILIEGPNLGDAFRGDQVAGAYLDRVDLLRALDESTDFQPNR